MKVLQVIFGMVALTLVSWQTYRHVFVLWIEPRVSVLAKYDKTEQEIGAAQSLDELVALYDKARLEPGSGKSTTVELSKDLKPVYVVEETPSPRAEELKKAIEKWEDHDRQLYRLHFYWWTGLASVLAGFFGYYLINRWLGITGIIAGFSEMIWWTSPMWRLKGSNIEFDRLLQMKFYYSTVTYVFVLAAWMLLGGLFRRRQRMAAISPKLHESLPLTPAESNPSP